MMQLILSLYTLIVVSVNCFYSARTLRNLRRYRNEIEDLRLSSLWWVVYGVPRGTTEKARSHE